jgi:hypothetical protein
MMFNLNHGILAQSEARLSEYENIFWVIGASSAGKTTVCQTISAERPFNLYDMDEHIFGSYMGLYSWERHPASKSWFSAKNSLEWILSLSSEEFDNLNRAANGEYLDLFAEEISNSPAQSPLLVDGGITHPSILAQAIPPERIFCIEVTPEESARAWNNDPGRASMKSAILDLANPQAAWQKFLDFDRLITETIVIESREAGVFVYRRDEHTSVSSLEGIILDHFGQ